MKAIQSIVAIFLVLCNFSCNPELKKSAPGSVDVAFNEDSFQFTEDQKASIREVIYRSDQEVRNLLPHLPSNIKVMVEIVDWDLEVVGGVTGRTERNSPPLVHIQISNKPHGGIVDSLKTALRGTIYHEFHHLSRGWAIQDNKFGHGIPNAMVNEGLAVVFAEIYTGSVYEGNAYPDEADTWVEEILALPLHASYSDWVMGEHPDGRTYIGYRTGNFLVRRAMAYSGKNILELSTLRPDELIQLAGY